MYGPYHWSLPDPGSERPKEHPPDVVLVHGDRYDLLPVAIAASYANITLAHTEGDDVTSSIDNRVRNATTGRADIITSP